MVSSDIVRMADKLSRRVQSAVVGNQEAEQQDLLGPSGSMVLLALSEMKSAPLYRLVQRVGRDKSQITRVVKSLVAQGLVNREVCRDDRRVIRLRLTDAGLAKVASLHATIDHVVDDVLVSLSGHEREQLRRLLLKVQL
ncbi:MAG: MarR family transcriptional regulator [Pseudomonadota bacterium]